MTTETTSRNPAIAALESLRDCRFIDPTYTPAGLVCGHDQIPLETWGAWYRHDPSAIRRLRETQAELIAADFSRHGRYGPADRL